MLGEVAVSIPLTGGPGWEVWPVGSGPGKLRRTQGFSLYREGDPESQVLPAPTPGFSWGGKKKEGENAAFPEIMYCNSKIFSKIQISVKDLSVRNAFPS